MNLALKTRSPVMKTHLDVLTAHPVQKARWFFIVVQRHKMLFVTRSVLVVTGKDSRSASLREKILRLTKCIFTL